jgi:glyoxylate reductase
MLDKPAVLITEPVFEEVLSLLQEHTHLTIGNRGDYNNAGKLREVIPKYDGLISMLSNPVNAAVLEKATKLKIVANYAVGYNNIDVAEASFRGIKVANTPDVLTETTAEGAFALLLAVARRLTEAEQSLRNGEFDGWNPNGFIGFDLAGKKLGIIGMGRIGLAFAKKAKCFGMKILYTNRNRLNPKIERDLGATFIANALELAKQSDIISIHCPLTSETHHLVNSDFLSLMKTGSIIINTARGAIIDEKALAESLHRRHLWGAGLDVFEHEPVIHPLLLTAPNTVLLPHVTSATHKTRLSMGMLAAGAILNELVGLDMECHFVN